MSLFRLLLLCLVLLVTTLTSINLVLFLKGTQDYLRQQLAIHAQDTATSFGLSLSPVLAQQDWVLAESMVDAIFDRGDYQTLILTGTDRQLLRRFEHSGERAPAWFRGLMDLRIDPSHTEINAGWQLVAKLEVVANPEPALLHLYRLAYRALLVSVVVALLAIGSGALILTLILKPLKGAQYQAEGLRRRRFIRQESLPFIDEFKALTLTMNKMVENSEALYNKQCERIDKLQKACFIDSETGLANDVRGRDRLDHLLKDRELESGVVAQVHLSGVEQMECQHGMAAVKPMLKALTETIRERIARFPLARVYRMSGVDFWIILPGMESQDWLANGEELGAELSEKLQQAGGERVAIVSESFRFGESVDAIEEKLHQQLQRHFSGEEVKEADRHRTSIEEQQRRLDAMLTQQPKLMLHKVINRDAELLYYEVLTRFFDGKQWRAPGAVVVLAERLQRSVELDVLVLQTLMEQCQQHDLKAKVAINLTSGAVLSQHFMEQLFQAANSITQEGGQLAVEIAESVVLEHISGVKYFIEQAQRRGISVWLDHITPAGLAELHQLPVEGIKLDAAYSRHLDQQSGYESLLPLMVAAAHAREVLVVAEQVEEQAVAQRLHEYQIDGLQGFAFSGPETFSQAVGGEPTDS
ncbi:bifunctional diguanylate cyclase/phosphodiesterase [Ferrimonas aestuarii]|uniref:EAL domain-containing protein n=1 Tax=Ferrimonas aestuarii TaxID=2569539 RepID=A0A4U1BPF5_9GAMM|nr:EAL domain-containing protein [Ferrimonas aestuarii]TKB56088.1 EAL domain-containing protein [Ferrimonas aestuarii]